jgi:ribosomal protein L11 methyltransferase
MTWIQIKIDARADQVSHCEDWLLEAGASVVTLEDGADQPLFEPPPGATPLWDHTRVVGLFEDGSDSGAVIAWLQQQAAPDTLAIRAEILEDKDWEREWMKNFHPIQCGQRLWICPSWREPPDPEAVNLKLDPGLAFGTGTHPTTALCLQWLDSQDLTAKYVIDYGCGSGILGIAALLLGAREVLGVDNDPQALLATRDNAQRNDVEERLRACLPDHVPARPADVMVANILAQPLIDLAPHLANLTAPGGLLALSGILLEQAEAVAERYREWFEITAIDNRNEWSRITGIRKQDAPRP